MEWVVVAALYLIGMGFFQLVGGVSTAAQAIQRWGRGSSIRRAKRLGLLPGAEGAARDS